MSKMLKSSGAMAFATLLSRMLGLVREIVLASYFGASWVKGAFDFAYMVPNLFRRLLGEGALTAAFIPIFKEKEKTEGEQAMWRAANATISGLVVVASGISVLAMLGISAALKWWTLETDTALMLELLRIMFPYMMLVCVAATFMGMLNSRGYFFIPAMGATLLNVVIISAVVIFSGQFGEELDQKIFVLAWAVLVAGVAQASFQLPTLYGNGFRYRWVSPWKNETVRVVVRRMLPGTFGVAAYQINMLVTQGIALTISAEIVSIFVYANRLLEFPQGLLGVSLATYVLPTLTGLAAEKNFADFRATLNQCLSYAGFFNLFAVAIAFVLAEPIVRLLLERGAFSATDTSQVALVIRCLAPSLAAYTIVNVIARSFYALGDVKTPMKISIVCLGLNLLFVFFLIRPFDEAGLGVANSMSSMFNVWLLCHALSLKLKNLDLKPLIREYGILSAVAVASGLVAWGVSLLWQRQFQELTLPVKAGAVFVPITVAGTFYWVLTYQLGISAAKDITSLIVERFSRRK